jgi:hypothetical protein
MWHWRRRGIAKADRIVHEAEKRNADAHQLAREAQEATFALRRQTEPNHFTDMLTRALQRGY